MLDSTVTLLGLLLLHQVSVTNHRYFLLCIIKTRTLVADHSCSLLHTLPNLYISLWVFGLGLSYSVTVLSTVPLHRLWVAPRLTAYHTLSSGPRPDLQCPFENLTNDLGYSALTPIIQPKLTLLLYCVRSGY